MTSAERWAFARWLRELFYEGEAILGKLPDVCLEDALELIDLEILRVEETPRGALCRIRHIDGIPIVREILQEIATSRGQSWIEAYATGRFAYL